VTIVGLETANYTLQYGYRKLWELVRINWMAALKLLLLTLPFGVHYTLFAMSWWTVHLQAANEDMAGSCKQVDNHSHTIYCGPPKAIGVCLITLRLS